MSPASSVVPNCRICYILHLITFRHSRGEQKFHDSARDDVGSPWQSRTNGDRSTSSNCLGSRHSHSILPSCRPSVSPVGGLLLLAWQRTASVVSRDKAARAPCDRISSWGTDELNSMKTVLTGATESVCDTLHSSRWVLDCSNALYWYFSHNRYVTLFFQVPSNILWLCTDVSVKADDTFETLFKVY